VYFIYCNGEILVYIGKSRRKETLGRRRHRWKDNMNMNLREIGWAVMERICLAQDMGHCGTLVEKVMSLQVP
jgi:hypothetical protein